MSIKKYLKLIGLVVVIPLALLVVTTALGQGPTGNGPDAAPTEEPGELQAAGDLSAQQVVFRFIPVQGRLTDKNGSPINGPVTVTLAIYPNSEEFPEIPAICSSTHVVTATNGLFEAKLGQGGNTCNENDLNGHRLWLGITVEGDEEMRPRQEILPVPYAFTVRPGAVIDGDIGNRPALAVLNTTPLTGTDLHGVSGETTSPQASNAGVAGLSNGLSSGVLARQAGVSGTNASALRIESENNDLIRAYSDLTGGDLEFRVTNTGTVFADGGYNCGNSITSTTTEAALRPCLRDLTPADFAEMLPASTGLEPGDVLVIGPEGELARSADPYQPTVVGVYSSRPSYLGNSQYWGQNGYAPLAIVGVVPVKASVENGAIQPGDLLVTSATPGHAMKAGEDPPTGTVIGKALSGLDQASGVIQMLVTLQ